MWVIARGWKFWANDGGLEDRSGTGGYFGVIGDGYVEQGLGRGGKKGNNNSQQQEYKERSIRQFTMSGAAASK